VLSGQIVFFFWVVKKEMNQQTCMSFILFIYFSQC
jgi:hypothetical protein